MPLSREVLRDALAPLFSPATMPASDAASAWLRAYAGYAQDAIAGGAVLALPLVIPPVAGEFLQAFDTGLRSMWMSAIWVGPGLTGTTAVVPPVIPSLLENSATLILSRDPVSGLEALATSIHTYTLSITVAIVLAAGTAVVPLQ